MEHDASNVEALYRYVFDRLNATRIALREAGADRATVAARLVDEMHRALVFGAAAAGGVVSDPDDLIGRPQVVVYTDADFMRGAKKVVDRRDKDAHYRTHFVVG